MRHERSECKPDAKRKRDSAQPQVKAQPLRKVLLTAAAALTLASVALSAGRATQTPAQTSSQESPAAYQAMVNKYCVTCHNVKARIPAGSPLTLDTANLQDPAAHPEIWEKVVRKLGVGAMPPQGSPSPGTEELTKFRSALITSLDSTAAKKN